MEINPWPPGQDGEIHLPCGHCPECQKAERLGWVLRNTLELQEHETATFATLTYSDDNLPPQLQLRDLQLFHKRLRRQLGAKKRGQRKVRHFSCGEYGDTTQRPHYHCILYGVDPIRDGRILEKAWGLGMVRSDPVNTARIHYIAGYTSKKIAQEDEPARYGWFPGYAERLDRETGEIIKHVADNYMLAPPFRTMSKNPGIGGTARQWRNSWRTHAVLEGRAIAVPDYYKRHWKNTATAEEKEEREQQLIENRMNRARTTGTPRTQQERAQEKDREERAQQEINQARQRERLARRTI